MRIAVLDDYQRRAREFADWDSLGSGAEVVFFSEAMGPDLLASELAGFEVVVLMRERSAFPASLLERLPALRLLITTGMGNASVDVEFAHDRGVVVCGTGMPPAAAGRPSTVEVAWALTFAVFKRVVAEDRALRAGSWQTDFPRNLAGSVLGLAGLGRLGGAMVEPARVFGMDVIAWSQNLTAERAAEAGVRLVSKAELLSSSDVMSIHLVLSERSRGLFGAADLGLMKPSAVLINTSRGPIVDERALVSALQDGTIAGAGLDVFDREPLPADHPLLSLDNTVLLPHLGYVSEDAFRAMYGQVVEDIAAYADGSPIRVIS